ncbi:MAG: hypothetical protein ACXABY_22465, partial [Candidatus Thorarchaeota archaeon]
TQLAQTLVNSGTLGSVDEYNEYINRSINEINSVEDRNEVIRAVHEDLGRIYELGKNDLGDDWLVNYGMQFENDRAVGQVDTNRGRRAQQASDADIRALQDQLVRRYAEDPRGAVLAASQNPELMDIYGDYWNRREGYREEDSRREQEEQTIAQRDEAWAEWQGQANRMLENIDNPADAYRMAMDRYDDEDIASNARDYVMQRNSMRRAEADASRARGGDGDDEVQNEYIAHLETLATRAEAMSDIQATIDSNDDLIQQINAELVEAKGEDDPQQSIIDGLNMELARARANSRIYLDMRRMVSSGEVGAFESSSDQVNVAEEAAREADVERSRAQREEELRRFGYGRSEGSDVFNSGSGSAGGGVQLGGSPYSERVGGEEYRSVSDGQDPVWSRESVERASDGRSQSLLDEIDWNAF